VSGTTPTGSTGTSDRSLGQIVGDVTQDLSALVRQELHLAKTEAKQEASRAGRGAGLLTGAGIAGHLLLVFVSLALMFLLDNWMPIEVAALITALVWLVVAAVLGAMGRKALRETNPALPEKQRSLKEDAQWARAQKS
jgi:ABC-type multidrug transport system fused ATPase/permease subunit